MNPMEPNTFRDPIWQFVGAVIGAIAIIVSLCLAWLLSKRKRLTYFARLTPLLSVDDALREKIQILYEGKPVLDVSLLAFGIKNAGNVPLLPTDFIKPVEFFFGDESQILTAKVISTDPPDLGPNIRWVGSNPSTLAASSVIIDPLLLNAGDQITLDCLIAGATHYDIRGRITGVKLFEEDKLKPRLLPFIFGIGIGISSVVSIWWISSLFHWAWRDSLIILLLFSFFFYVAFIEAKFLPKLFKKKILRT